MADYHVLKIDSLIESLTLCNTANGFTFTLDSSSTIVAQSGGLVLGYISAPTNKVCYLFEIISADGNSLELKKKLESSDGVAYDFSTLPELQPDLYEKQFFPISESVFLSILSRLSSIHLPSSGSVKDDKTAQVIYYGCPGTGKSHQVKKITEGEDGRKVIWYEKPTSGNPEGKKVDHEPDDEEKKSLTNNIFRTTFHPDYDYATFVGCYKPGKDKDDKLDYKFVPQVFTNAYVAAMRHPEDPIYLIIEEINRGNCAQIFGDLFQLLDRTGGVSDYEIKPDAELAKYLAGEGVPSESIKLPANLHLYATMNTSDQSLFPMDSAFKRRWAMEYVPIAYSGTKANTFTITIGKKQYQWIEFLQMVNEQILNATESEDKQMGEFFIKESVAEKEFINKVMFYLWNDVCKDFYRPRRVQSQYFLRVKTQLDGEKNDYFTFAELFSESERNKDFRLLDELMLYLESKYKETHPDFKLTVTDIE